VRVEVRLYATFAAYAPTERAGDAFDVKFETSPSLADLIRRLGIPEDEVHLAIVNGRIIHDHAHPLREGDRIALFPPVGGG
jgi:molybdopterin synthase sulfur carrier subunit